MHHAYLRKVSSEGAWSFLPTPSPPTLSRKWSGLPRRRHTSQMQAVLDRWSNRRQVIPPELIGKIAPTRLESINLRGVFASRLTAMLTKSCLRGQMHR